MSRLAEALASGTHPLHFKHFSLMCHQSDVAGFLEAFQWKLNWSRFRPAQRNTDFFFLEFSPKNCVALESDFPECHLS